MVERLIFKTSQIVSNLKKDAELTKEGYTIFPCLEDADIKALQEYYLQFQKEEPNHFYATAHSPDFNFRKQTSDFIKKIVEPHVKNTLCNYRLLGGSYVVKPGKDKGILQAHQDWNLVDETKARSYNLWIPLVDVSIENGAVFVLAQSHAKQKTYRGPHIPSVLKNTEELLWQKMKPLTMKAGEGLLYDHALIHGSPPNNSSLTRIAIVIGLVAKETPLQLCFGENNQLNVYNITPDFFLSQNPMMGPMGLEFIRCIGEIPPAIDSHEIQKMYLSNKKNWFSKFIKWK